MLRSFLTLLGFSVFVSNALFAQSGPSTNPEQIARVVKAAPQSQSGAFQPTWQSVKEHYQVPAWFREAKFGIMMHWGLYSVPAHASEWYGKHMYGNAGITKWHTEKFGPPDKFGYKDFIPLFTAEKFDADAWAVLFRESGARYIIPTAQHHDGFALWDSALTKWDAKDMGPKRDLIGELAVAVRKQGLKFGVSDHGIEHFTFIQPTAGLKTDLNDPAAAEFYSVADRSPEATERFLTDWVARNFELIDKYQPDMLWYDNGLNGRVFDPLKLKIAAHYYNRAAQWKKEVSISSKGHHEKGGLAFPEGSILDFERQSRAPKQATGHVWQVDDPVLFRFGYTEGSPITNAQAVIHKLVNNVSRNGALLLNISPKADGTIPDNQQALLREIGAWLRVNGEGIYGTEPWTVSNTLAAPTAPAASAAAATEPVAPVAAAADEKESDKKTADDGYRFTRKGENLYAITLKWPGEETVIAALRDSGSEAGKVTSVALLGDDEELEFTQDASGLRVKLPAVAPCNHAFVLRVKGVLR